MSRCRAVAQSVGLTASGVKEDCVSRRSQLLLKDGAEVGFNLGKFC
ncbi:MAG: hypothetical protein ACYTX0_39535 [Nostoc sp.]